jgi:sugar phosphate isomerase/epimerase
MPREIGFPIVEVRREYILSGKTEMKEIMALASSSGLKVYYSVPAELFEAGALNDQLSSYFEEASLLSAVQLKLTLGEFRGFTAQLAEELRALLKAYAIHLTIENDQTSEKGSPAVLMAFIAEARKASLDIGLTFDTVNFVYIDTDPFDAAKEMREAVAYIHIKNVAETDEGIVLSGLESGLVDMRQLLSLFPDSVPASIEYPCGIGDEVTKIISADYKKIRSW